MGRYQQALLDHIEKNPEFIASPGYRNEVLGLLREPLEDLCISRPKTRLTWGIDLPFDDAMLNWPAGRRDSDGVWGEHWYGAVIDSTGFAPPHKTSPTLPDDARRLADTARPYYEALLPFALSL